MATAAVGVLDPFESTLTYSTAGHPPPAVMRGNDAIERLELGSLPLGVAHLGTCPERVVQLSAGDAVIFYTDGLIEATRDVKEGEERLLTALRTERDASSYPRATAILRSVLGAAVPKDDVAVLTVGVIIEHAYGI